MANDYLKKEPTKTEKMIYELYMQHQSMEKGLWSTSTLVIVAAILGKLEPKQIAELMVNGNDKIKEFSKQVNDEIEKLEKEKRPAGENHDHSHEGHDHSHDHEETPEAEEKTEEIK